MASLHYIVFDSSHPTSLARFWASVLDDYAVTPYGVEELERLRSHGIFDIEDDPTVLIEPKAPGLPRIFCQLVPEGKPGEPRTGLHLDLMPAQGTRADEVERVSSSYASSGVTLSG